MVIRLYTVHDKVALESGPIFSAKNGSVARRQFVNMLKKENALDAEDYDLLEVGKYNTETSVVEGYEVPELVMSGYKAMLLKDPVEVEVENE